MIHPLIKKSLSYNTQIDLNILIKAFDNETYIMTLTYRFIAYFSQQDEPRMFKDFPTFEQAQTGFETIGNMNYHRYKIVKMKMSSNGTIIRQDVVQSGHNKSYNPTELDVIVECMKNDSS